MTVTTLGAAFASLVFLGAMAVVIYTDLRSRLIHNKLILVLLTSYAPLAIASGGTWQTILAGIAAGSLVLVLGFLCFASGWMGGGDAKLMPVTALWLGPVLSLPYILYGAAIGGLLTIGVLIFRKARKREPAQNSNELQALEVPYGPALALSGAGLFLQSWWVGQI